MKYRDGNVTQRHLAMLRKNIAVDVLHKHIFLICKAWFFILLLKWHVLTVPYEIVTIIHINNNA